MFDNYKVEVSDHKLFKDIYVNFVCCFQLRHCACIFTEENAQMILTGLCGREHEVTCFTSAFTPTCEQHLLSNV